MDTKALKDKILQLAMRGKLTPQDPNDEPASIFLRKIKEQNNKGKHTSQPMMDDEMPYKLPIGWEWERLGDLGQIVGGGTPKTGIKEYWAEGEEGIPWLTPSDLSGYKEMFIERGKRNITEEGLKKSSTQMLPEGSIVFTSRAPIGYVAIAKNEVSTNQGFKSIIPYEIKMNKFIYWFLRYAKEDINDRATGTTFKEVSGEKMKLEIIPVPPLAEQIRIVEKVDEVFNLIEKLDNNKDDLIRKINTIKNKVLQEALHGHLVPQDPTDEPATELIKRIQAERDKLVNEGKIKKQKSLPPIESDEIPFELPKGWEWVRMQELSDTKDYSFVDGPFGSNLKKEHYTDSGVRIIQLSNIGEGFWRDENKKFTSSVKADELIRCNAYSGDLVIAKMMPAGRTCKLPGINQRYVLASDSVKFRPHQSIFIDYIMYALNSPIIRSCVSDNTAGITRTRTSLGKLQVQIIPIPPQEEQYRIVSKIESIMDLLDQMENELYGKVDLIGIESCDNHLIEE